VNDGNARAMGGIAPHAGLFGTARQVAEVAMRWVAGDVPRAREAFARKGPGTHALGWDTPNPDGTSSAGPHPPADAVGHLGFTGTSIWMSPSARRVAVLLTNRVATGPDLAGIRALRRAFHEAAWRA
jgi:CubicO group peptidase (beta-lactamase class C family)